MNLTYTLVAVCACLLLGSSLVSYGGPMEGHPHHQHVGPIIQDDDGMGMAMYFINTWQTTLWFRSWEMKTPLAYGVSIVCLLIFAVLHEGLSVMRGRMLSKMRSKLVFAEDGASIASARHPKSGLMDRALMTTLYVINMTSSYLLMLAVMTFNVGYFFAVIVGLGAGYMLFYDSASPSTQARSDSCHVRLLEEQ